MDNTLKQRNRGYIQTRKQHKRSKKRLIFVSILLVVCASIFVLLMNQAYFQIKDLELEGLHTLSEEDMQQTIHEYMAGKRFWFIPRSNIFFVRTNKLEAVLQDNFPRIAEISISLEHADTLLVRLTERDARLLWCVDQEYTSVFDEECYFTDHSGIFYTKAPYFSDRVFLKVFVPPEVTLLEENTSFYTEAEISDFLHFIETLQDKYQIGIQRAYLDSFGDMRLVIYRIYDTVLRSEPEIIYTRNQSYEELVRNIDLTLHHDSFVRNFNQHPERFEKIDLRFEGRLIYKFNLGS